MHLSPACPPTRLMGEPTDIAVVLLSGERANGHAPCYQVSELTDTTNDPLALKLRNELKQRSSLAGTDGESGKGGGEGKANYVEGIKVIYSYEKASVKLARLDKDQAQNPNKYGAIAGQDMLLNTSVLLPPCVVPLMLPAQCHAALSTAPSSKSRSKVCAGRCCRCDRHQISRQGPCGACTSHGWRLCFMSV